MNADAIALAQQIKQAQIEEIATMQGLLKLQPNLVEGDELMPVMSAIEGAFCRSDAPVDIDKQDPHRATPAGVLRQVHCPTRDGAW